MSKITNSFSACFLITLLGILFLLIHEVNAEQGQFQMRGIGKPYTKAISKIVSDLENQLDPERIYNITVAGFHPSSGKNLVFSSIIEAELVKEFSSNRL